ncbi:MAG: hydrogenase expression protein [Synergistaceae bacterium]|nr:hydrogenase expression protein [Synergistaceae bacterium]
MNLTECNGRDAAAAFSGKLPPDALTRSVLSNRGTPRPEVLIGPAVGEDAAVIEWPAGKLMVIASDPIVGASRGAGKLLVRVNVNDIASKGGEPAYMTVTLILPPEMGERTVSSIMKEIHDECLENGIAIVGGHTEFSGRYRHPVMSATLVGTADRVLDASDISRGDAILVSKHVGIEGMAILASDRPDLLETVFSRGEIREMEGWSDLTSVLPESRLLRGYSSFMHDPTEGGFRGGISEICRLSGMSANIGRDSVPVHEYTLRASKALGFDPLRLVASGSMIAIVPGDRVGDVMDAFRDLPIAMTVAGSIEEARGTDAVPDSRDTGEEIWALLNRRGSGEGAV